MNGGSIRRDALARVLSSRLHACSFDELRVLDVVLTRLELGRDQYGPLDLSRRRDWKREAAEEVVDERFYEACRVISERDDRVATIAVVTRREPLGRDGGLVAVCDDCSSEVEKPARPPHRRRGEPSSERAAQVRAHRDQLASEGICIYGRKHGAATRGLLCEACYTRAKGRGRGR